MLPLCSFTNKKMSSDDEGKLKHKDEMFWGKNDWEQQKKINKDTEFRSCCFEIQEFSVSRDIFKIVKPNFSNIKVEKDSWNLFQLLIS